MVISFVIDCHHIYILQWLFTFLKDFLELCIIALSMILHLHEIGWSTEQEVKWEKNSKCIKKKCQRHQNYKNKEESENNTLPFIMTTQDLPRTLATQKAELTLRVAHQQDPHLLRAVRQGRKQCSDRHWAVGCLPTPPTSLSWSTQWALSLWGCPNLSQSENLQVAFRSPWGGCATW